MPRQLDRSVWLNLHTFVAAERLEIFKIEFKSGSAGHQQVAHLADICVLAVRSESHNFAFIPIFVVADELANHGVEAAERMGEEHAVEHLNIALLAARHHRGDKITGAVVAESGRLLPR